MDHAAHGFFSARRQLDTDHGDWQEGSSKYAEYLNVPRSIGAVISADKATLRELQEYYSIRDVYSMLEIISIDAHNRRVAAKAKD